jgi:hypothetical protein
VAARVGGCRSDSAARYVVASSGRERDLGRPQGCADGTRRGLLPAKLKSRCVEFSARSRGLSMPDPLPSRDSAPRCSSGVGAVGALLGGTESATPAQELLVTGGWHDLWPLRLPGGMPPL